MEARFIIRHTLHREDMIAFVRTAGRRSRILLCLLALVWWAYFALEVYWYYWDIYHTLLLVLAAALTLLAVVFPRIVGWKLWHSRNSNAAEATLAFMDDCVRVSTNLSEGTTQYDIFMRIVESDRYFYLYTQKKLAHILPKASFNQGNPAEFGAFITEKTGLPIKHVRG